jgi:putrescine transport system ATP-binding protein
MSAGRFVQVGEPRDIYEAPANRFVADFIGTVNLFEGTLIEDLPDRCVIECPAGRFHVDHGISGFAGQRFAVALRPEKIELSDLQPTADERNCFPGRVASAAYFGASSLYRIALADGSQLQVSVPNADRHGDAIAVGAEVFARFAGNAVVVLPN